jgi:hypothetical protein
MAKSPLRELRQVFPPFGPSPGATAASGDSAGQNVDFPESACRTTTWSFPASFRLLGLSQKGLDGRDGSWKLYLLLK